MNENSVNSVPEDAVDTGQKNSVSGMAAPESAVLESAVPVNSVPVNSDSLVGAPQVTQVGSGVQSVTLATAQSYISADVRENGREIRRLIELAKHEGADIVHFPEGAMSGYIRRQILDWNDVDWSILHEELNETARLAGELGIWVVLGSNHQLNSPNRPHNSVYIISDQGVLHNRHDKHWCTKDELTGWYEPGGVGITMFEVNGVRFGIALSVEVQFSEIFVAYAMQDVHCILYSCYAELAEVPMFATQAQAQSITNNMWFSFSLPAQISANGSSHMIAPSGHVLGSCEPKKSGVITTKLDVQAPEWSYPMQHLRPWRAHVRQEGVYQQYQVEDERSENRTQF